MKNSNRKTSAKRLSRTAILGLGAAAAFGLHSAGWVSKTAPNPALGASMALVAPDLKHPVVGIDAFFDDEQILSLPSDTGTLVVDASAKDKSAKTERETALAKMSKAVEQLALSGGDQVVELLVTYSNTGEQTDVEVSRLQQLGGEITSTYSAFPFVALQLTADELIEFASGGDVQLLDLDAEVGASQYSARRSAGAEEQAINWNYVGTGPTVAIVDSGISAHMDLSGVREFRCDAGKCKSDNKSGDRYGHGTHVAGIVAGTGERSFGDYRGVSGSASLLSLQVLDGEGKGKTSSVLNALDWIITNGADHGVRVVNLSLGKAITQSCDVDPLCQAAEMVWDAGFVVVVAAGNYG
ncbi:MAG: subtilisin family serine protease, partial [Candidatus Azotimanducaceae bacterium]